VDGKRWRVAGASRMGDLLLSDELATMERGYSLRACVDDCSAFSPFMVVATPTDLRIDSCTWMHTPVSFEASCGHTAPAGQIVHAGDTCSNCACEITFARAANFRARQETCRQVEAWITKHQSISGNLYVIITALESLGYLRPYPRSKA
jgi:hypothetical protein